MPTQQHAISTREEPREILDTSVRHHLTIDVEAPRSEAGEEDVCCLFFFLVLLIATILALLIFTGVYVAQVLKSM